MKDAIEHDFVDRLRAECDIIGVIADYVPLKKKGKNYWGCCPFHHEKTPSFSVAPEKGFFYCFGCQSGGNIFNFLMKVENLGFIEAVKLLAHKMNVPLPEKEKTVAEQALEREKSRLYRVNELAQDFFHACLTKTNYGKPALVYLAERGISVEIITNFKLGFAPPAWDKLLHALAERGMEAEIVGKAGLIVSRNSGEGFYDRFRSRVMIPICDSRGRVVGFGGRVLDNSQPKYLNSPETTVFNKRHILYGLHMADKFIRQTGQVIVVEGYMDVITAHAAGIKNVVASLGTAFTVEQARQLRNISEIIFAYDSDIAGQSATLRALDTVRTVLGSLVKVVVIPDGKDPDEFIRKHGAEEFRTLVGQSLPLLDYQVQQAFSSTDYSDLAGKVAVVTKVVPALAATENDVEMNAHIAHIAQMLAIDENSIRSEVRKFLVISNKDKVAGIGKHVEKVALRSSVNRPTVAVAEAQQTMIRLMCENNELIPSIRSKLVAEDIQDAGHQELIKAIFTAYDRGNSIMDMAWLSSLSEATSAELSRIMLIDMQCDDVEKMVDDCMKMIHVAHLKKMYEQHRLRADELERMGDSNFLQELAESQRIKNEINKLHY